MTNQETQPNVLVLGVKDNTRAARTVKTELRRAGLGSVRFGRTADRIPNGSWLLLLGKDAGTDVLGAGSPERVLTDSGASGFAFTTYHPEYVRRRPSLLKQWRRDLETFVAFAKVDLYGNEDHC
jgi:hypothetical protein